MSVLTNAINNPTPSVVTKKISDFTNYNSSSEEVAYLLIAVPGVGNYKMSLEDFLANYGGTGTGSSIDLSKYAKKTDLEQYAKASDLEQYAKASDLEQYAKASDVNLNIKTLTEAVNKLETTLNTLIGSDSSVSDAIDTYNEVLAFLKDYKDNQTLKEVLADKVSYEQID